MNRFFYPLFFLAAVLLETTVRHFPTAGLRIDLLWLTVLYFGFYLPFDRGFLWVLLLGFLQETLSTPFHGILMFPYLLIFSFLRAAHRQLFFHGKSSQVIWVSLLTLVHHGLGQLLLLWQGYEVFFNLGSEIAGSLLHGLITLLLFPFLLAGRHTKEEMIHAP